MFKKDLADKLKRIFDLKKVSFNNPGESQEQECLFIEIENSKNNVRDGKITGRVVGSAIVFGNSDKLPYGYFSKRIYQADSADTKDFFFYDVEENVNRFQNIVQRSFSFVYLYDTQYDPAFGSISSINFSQQVNE